jgi:HK97 family phage portal protein
MFLPSFGGPAEQKFRGGTSVSGLREAEYPAPNFLNHVEQGFSRNEVVYACVTEKSTSLGEAPLRVYPDSDGGGEPNDRHPLRELIRRPNPILSEFELWELTDIYLELAGNAPWWVVRDRLGRPVELWPIRPDMLRVIPHPNPQIHHTFAIQYDGESEPIPVGRDIIHFKYPNPGNEYLGMAPLQAALRATALDNEATSFVKAFLQNDATPATVIKTAQAVDEAAAETLKRKWKESFTGSKRGEPAVLQVGMEVEKLGFSLREMEFPDLRTIAETRITMAFHVPAILVGAKAGLDRSTFSNAEEARKSFWEQTIMPLQRRLGDRLFHFMQGEFPGVGSVHFDNSDVVALREAQKDKWDRATQAFRAGGITRNQYLRELGLPDIGKAGDVFMTPAGVIPVPVSSAGEPIGEELQMAAAYRALAASSVNGGPS